jgi:hypothetical protein
MTTLQDLVNNFYQKPIVMSEDEASKLRDFISDDEAQQMLATIKDSNDLYVQFDLINQLFDRYQNILSIKSDLIKFDYILNLLKAVNNRHHVKIVDNTPQITELGKSKLQPLFDKAYASSLS